jgi:phosphohistidine phosphatase
MELILWRHAEAEPGEPDSERILTPKGQKQAKKMADWLDRHLPDHCRILVSPTMRTLQTADALGRSYHTAAALAPDATAERILSAVNWPDSRKPVLVVGHQPSLGQLAALLLAGTQQDWTIRKANVLWIAQKACGEMPAIHLKAAIGPQLLGR